MPSRPILVGITGGIGAGKTIVCNIFKSLGVLVYDADTRAKSLMVSDPHLIASIKSIFGETIYLVNGQLDRINLANQIFKDQEKLRLMNSLVHPVVAKDFEKWIIIHEKNTYLLKEAALLVESASYKSLDYLITVTTPVETRISRVLSRDAHRTRENVEDIISKQLSEDEKIAKSQFVITNDDQSLVIPQVLKIHEQLISSK